MMPTWDWHFFSEADDGTTVDEWCEYAITDTYVALERADALAARRKVAVTATAYPVRITLGGYHNTDTSEPVREYRAEGRAEG